MVVLREFSHKLTDMWWNPSLSTRQWCNVDLMCTRGWTKYELSNKGNNPSRQRICVGLNVLAAHFQMDTGTLQADLWLNLILNSSVLCEIRKWKLLSGLFERFCSCGKVMFLHVSVILSTGGWQAETPPWADIPLGQTPPWADTPMGRHPHGQTPLAGRQPLGRHPQGWPLQGTVSILLECVLVGSIFCING